ncbi:transposase [Gluconobacter japonicus]|uniref:transposase n=1 Tax=Gluconobacter japonicus TaxID=376620 RepID=UPI0039E7FF11
MSRPRQENYQRVCLSPAQNGILWVLRKRGALRFVASGHRDEWRIEDLPDGVVVRNELTRTALLDRGLVVSDGDVLELTEYGQQVAAQIRIRPRSVQVAAPVSLFWVGAEQAEQVAPVLPVSRSGERLDGLQALSGIVHVLRTGQRWVDAPGEYGPTRLLHTRFVRWARSGVLDQALSVLLERRDGVVRLVVSEAQIRASQTALPFVTAGCFPVMAPPLSEMVA